MYGLVISWLIMFIKSDFKKGFGVKIEKEFSF